MFQKEAIYTYLTRAKKETLIMGILNITPDSFSDGGKFHALDAALARGLQMEKEGAHIIDVGGESTRPGHQPIGADEELSRVIPVIERLSKEVNIPISIDTYKADVAKAAIKAGASIINDIWGAKKDENMGAVAAELQVPIVLMHNRMMDTYQNFLPDFMKDLKESIDIVKAKGVCDHQIILDPGIGFAKNFEQNVEVMKNLDQLCTFGYPVLLAVSKKRMIGTILDLPVEERTQGSVASICLGVTKGVQMVRVHDVKETKRALQIMDVLLGKRGLSDG